ncbi:MAG: translation initiation factor IF-2 N-terminal domain-containing protein, partial [Synergistaceae bacterium]|nr:translation initiation factor IF-2 N-terminal domain-containing protein [Synergistaceae bacterium]
MNKIRVYELAKLLGRTNPELLDILKELEIEVKSHMSSIDMECAQRVEEHIAGKTASPNPSPDAAVPAKKEEPAP